MSAHFYGLPRKEKEKEKKKKEKLFYRCVLVKLNQYIILPIRRKTSLKTDKFDKSEYSAYQ